jgi:hypothetical protein
VEDEAAVQDEAALQLPRRPDLSQPRGALMGTRI